MGLEYLSALRLKLQKICVHGTYGEETQRLFPHLSSGEYVFWNDPSETQQLQKCEIPQWDSIMVAFVSSKQDTQIMINTHIIKVTSKSMRLKASIVYNTSSLNLDLRHENYHTLLQTPATIWSTNIQGMDYRCRCRTRCCLSHPFRKICSSKTASSPLNLAKMKLIWNSQVKWNAQKSR